MVKKGTYHVQDPEGGQPAVEDTSYKSCLCVLLIFISFCVIIIVFSSFNWFKGKEKQPLVLNKDTELLEKEKLSRYKELEANRSKESDKETERVDRNSDGLTTTQKSKENEFDSNEKEDLKPVNPEVVTSTNTTTSSILIPPTLVPSKITTLTTIAPTTTIASSTIPLALVPFKITTLTTVAPTMTIASSTIPLALVPDTTKTSTKINNPSTIPETTVPTKTTTSTISPPLGPSNTATSTTVTIPSTTPEILAPATTAAILIPPALVPIASTIVTPLTTTPSSTIPPALLPSATTTSTTKTTSSSTPTTQTPSTSTSIPPVVVSATTSTLIPPVVVPATATTSTTVIPLTTTTSSTIPPALLPSATTTSTTKTTSSSTPTTQTPSTSTSIPPVVVSATTSTSIPPVVVPATATTSTTVIPLTTTTSSTIPPTLVPSAATTLNKKATSSSTPTTQTSTTSTSIPPVIVPATATTSTTVAPLTTIPSSTIPPVLVSSITTTSTTKTTSSSTPPTPIPTTTTSIPPVVVPATATTSTTVAPLTTIPSSTIPPVLVPSITTTSTTKTTSSSTPPTPIPTTTTSIPPGLVPSITTTSNTVTPLTTTTSTTTPSALVVPSTKSTAATVTTPPITTKALVPTTTASTLIPSTTDGYHLVPDSTVTMVNQISAFAKNVITSTLSDSTTTEASDGSKEVSDEASPEDYEPNIKTNLTSRSVSSTSSISSATTSSTAKAPTNTKGQQTAMARLRNKFKISISDMLASMDHTIDMCEDFYSYSCGRAPKKNLAVVRRQNEFKTILNEESRNTGKFVFVDKMTQFYDTCLRHESLFDYNQRLNEVQEIVGNLIKDEPETEDFTDLISKMILSNTLPIMDVDIDVDQDTKKYVFTLSPPYKSLTRNPLETSSELYNTDSNCAKKLLRDQRLESQYLNLDTIYKNYAICTKDFDRYILSFNITKNSFDYLNTMFYVENEILDYIKDVEASSIRNSFMSKDFEKKTLADLQKEFVKIDWKLLFKKLSGKELDNSDEVFVYEKDILFKIFNELNPIPTNQSYKSFLSVYTNDLFQATVIPKSSDLKDDYCLDLVANLFSDVSSYLYMKRLPQEKILKTQELAENIFKILKTNFLISVDNTTGIEDEADKKLIKDEITKLSLNFMSNSDGCISDLTLKQNYESIDLGLSYVSQFVEMKKHKNIQKYLLVGEHFKDDDTFCYFIQPQDFKPKSFYFTSKISIPYEFLMPYNMDYPGCFLMAKIGTQIAIEMGKHFNKIGLNNIGLNDISILDGLHSELTEEFFIVNDQNITITAPEVKNIQTVSDNAGFHLAHKSFNQLQTKNTLLPWIDRDFSEERLFFIAAAQEFCEEKSISNDNRFDFMLKMFEGKDNLPNLWRVNKMIINTKEFQSTFRCKIGSAMAPSGASYKAFPDVADEEDY